MIDLPTAAAVPIVEHFTGRTGEAFQTRRVSPGEVFGTSSSGGSCSFHPGKSRCRSGSPSPQERDRAATAPPGRRTAGSWGSAPTLFGEDQTPPVCGLAEPEGAATVHTPVNGRGDREHDRASSPTRRRGPIPEASRPPRSPAWIGWLPPAWRLSPAPAAPVGGAVSANPPAVGRGSYRTACRGRRFHLQR